MPRRLGTALVLASLLLGACGTGGGAHGTARGRLTVVAAENFWGSITAALAGDRAQVSSIITNPATDPHDYEATPQDAREVASADLVIVNGIGYDAWAQKLLDADPSSKRSVVDVGKLVGVNVGGNPHQWYSPGNVDKFIATVTRELVRLDPADASYFAARRTAYETTGLAEYHALITQIRQRFAGTPVGASESIVTPLVAALGLTMKTPESFLDAIAEGNEPSAADTATAHEQIADGAIKAFVFNSQNATPDVQRLVDAARAKGIPVVTVTETLTPAGATFAAWQTAELRSLRDALSRSQP
jgi:zinc/manganese transport system substrate-binding protein